MARKRKLEYPVTTANRQAKKQKPTNLATPTLQEHPHRIHHDVLSSFYPRVCTLRNYLLGGLPTTSRIRRRKLTAFGKDDPFSILDTCLVGVSRPTSLSVKESRKVDFVTFTQDSYRATNANTARTQASSIHEVGHVSQYSSFSVRRSDHIF